MKLKKDIGFKRFFICRAFICGIFFSLLSFPLNVKGQNKTQYNPNQFYGREYRLDGDTLKYRVLYPSGYDSGLKFPLFIFLHGENERGWNNILQMKYGGKLYIEQTNRDYYPAVVILPQCPTNDGWAVYNVLNGGEIEIPDNPMETRTEQVVAKLINHYMNLSYVDKNRIYLVGMDDGAMGALDLLARYPDWFTAVVSMSGTVFPDRLQKIKKVAVRMYNGEEDKVVRIESARDVYNQLKANGCEADIVEYRGTGHDTWTTALAGSDFLEWIFDKKKKK